MTPIGVAIAAPLPSLPSVARELERRGYQSAWVFDSRRDATIQAAVLAQNTSTITIGTNTALAFPRSPTMLAMAAWDINELSRGRFSVGLGNLGMTLMSERFSAEASLPAKRMREYMSAMQAVWRQNLGEEAFFDGQFYKVLRPGPGGLVTRGTPGDVPGLLLAAQTGAMLRAATGLADGVIGPAFASEKFVTDWALPLVADGLDAAGRSRSSFAVHQGLVVSIDHDRQVAMDRARRQVAWLARQKNYDPIFRESGDAELAQEAQKAAKQGPLPLSAFSDTVTQRYAVVATPDEAQQRLSAWGRHVDHLILSTPWVDLAPAEHADAFAAMVESCAPGR